MNFSLHCSKSYYQARIGLNFYKFKLDDVFKGKIILQKRIEKEGVVTLASEVKEYSDRESFLKDLPRTLQASFKSLTERVVVKNTI